MTLIDTNASANTLMNRGIVAESRPLWLLLLLLLFFLLCWRACIIVVTVVVKLAVAVVCAVGWLSPMDFFLEAFGFLMATSDTT